jgi:hypothetical protein
VPGELEGPEALEEPARTRLTQRGRLHEVALGERLERVDRALAALPALGEELGRQVRLQRRPQSQDLGALGLGQEVGVPVQVAVRVQGVVCRATVRRGTRHPAIGRAAAPRVTLDVVRHVILLVARTAPHPRPSPTCRTGTGR